MLDLPRRQQAAGRSAEAIHTDIHRAVEEDDKRLDRLGSRRAVAPREAVLRPADVSPCAEVVTEGEEAVAPEDAALCARACISGRRVYLFPPEEIDIALMTYIASSHTCSRPVPSPFYTTHTPLCCHALVGYHCSPFPTMTTAASINRLLIDILRSPSVELAALAQRRLREASHLIPPSLKFCPRS